MRRFLLAAVMLGAAAGAQAADMPDLPILRGAFTEGPTAAPVRTRDSASRPSMAPALLPWPGTRGLLRL